MPTQPHTTMKTRKKRQSVYQRIMRAAKQGRGLNLSSQDVFTLSRDTAISDAAYVDSEKPQYQ